MGNCQAAEAAMLLIQHPDGKVERLYSSITAAQVMGSNPGNYVAVFVAPPPPPSSTNRNEKQQRHLKLMRPDDTLQIGHVYRLVSFEEVLKEITAKKHVKLGKLVLSQQLKEKEKSKSTKRKERRYTSGGDSGGSRGATVSKLAEEEEEQVMDSGVVSGRVGSWPGRRHGGGGQWRPVLQTIGEVVEN